MKYIDIAHVNKRVSRIVCGTAAAPYNTGADCNELLSGMLALGVNVFDTARVYGGAERALGRWISGCGVRADIVLITKCCHPDIFGRRRVNARAMRADLKRSLSLLNTGYVDIFLLHRDDPSVPAGELVEELNALHAEGRIGAFGGSNWTYARVAEANEYAYAHGLVPFAVSSPDFSLAVRARDIWGGGESISGTDMARVRRGYAENGIAVLAYSALARGLFSGKFSSGSERAARAALDKYAAKGYLTQDNLARLARCEKLARMKGVTVAQIALAYVLCAQSLSMAAVSCSRIARMEENALAADMELSAEEISYLEGGIAAQ